MDPESLKLSVWSKSDATRKCLGTAIRNPFKLRVYVLSTAYQLGVTTKKYRSGIVRICGTDSRLASIPGCGSDDENFWRAQARR
jgi:hypothetical protein